MYVPAKAIVPTKGCKLMPLLSLQGTSSVESTNWQVALTAITATRLAASTTDMHLWKRFGIANSLKDRAVAHLMGKEEADLKDADWFLQEALLSKGSHVFASPQYKHRSSPPDVVDFDKPIGVEFLAFIDSEKYDRDLDIILNDDVDYSTRQLERKRQASESAAANDSQLAVRAAEDARDSPSVMMSPAVINFESSPSYNDRAMDTGMDTRLPCSLLGPLTQSQDMGYGSGWNRKIGGHTRKTVANFMIPGDLTKSQECVFLEIVNNYLHLYKEDRPLNSIDLVTKVQVAWRDRHFKTIPLNDFGLGGLLSPENIKRLLKKYGVQVSIGSMSAMAQFPALGGTPFASRPTSTLPLPDMSRTAAGLQCYSQYQPVVVPSMPFASRYGAPFSFPPLPSASALRLTSNQAPLARFVTITRSNINEHPNTTLQKALRKICAPRGHSKREKAREYLVLYFKSVRDPEHKIVVDLLND